MSATAAVVSNPPVPLQTSAIDKGELKHIPITDLHESPWNPRKYFPVSAMAELVESIRSKGFWEWNALMARPRSTGGYELGAGHRRYRAAKEAGLKTLPVWVRPMDDPEFLAVLTFDNSNREDPHPLDEAAGFRFYMDKTGATVTDIAGRIGQSKEYVYQRLKYADLIVAGQKAFWDGAISAGQAIQIARLPNAEQGKTLKHIAEYGKHRPVSERDLRDWIAREVHRDVSKVHFDPKDPNLVAGVPACSACIKRVGNSPELFPEISNPDTCTDPACFQRKQQTFVKIAIAQRDMEVKEDKSKLPLELVSESYFMSKSAPSVLLKSGYEVVEKSKRCENARDAIVVDGDLGKRLLICAAKKCPVHHPGAPAPTLKELAEAKCREAAVKREQFLDQKIPLAIATKCAVPFGKTELLALSQVLLDLVDVKGLAVTLGIKAVERKVSLRILGTEEDFVTPLIGHFARMPVADLARKVIEMAAGSMHRDEQRALAKMSFGIDLSKLVADAPVKKAAPSPSKKGPVAVAKKTAKKAVKKAVKKAKGK